MTNKQLLEFFGEEFLEALLAVRDHFIGSMSAPPTEEEMKLLRYWLRVDDLANALIAAVREKNKPTT
jgi:hypothetical protein